MTVSNTTNENFYDGNGSQTVFPYTFKVFAASDMEVYVGGQILTSGYTVSDVGNENGGNVTFDTAPPTGDGNVALVRSIPLTQGVDLVQYGKFDAEVIEEAFDKAAIRAQQQAGIESAAIRAGVSDPTRSTGSFVIPLKDARKGRVLAFNETSGDVEAGPVVSEISSINAIAQAITDVAAIDDDVTTVAGIDDDVTTVSGINTDVTTVAGVSANVTTCADDIAAIIAAPTHAATATTKAGEAAASLLACQAIEDNFDDRYLGSKTSDPTLDNDGNALQDGALYYNTTSNHLKVYDASSASWYAIENLTLGALLDVTLTSIAAGEILKWDGSKWINQTLAEAGIQPYDANTAKTDVATNFTAGLQAGGSDVVVDTDIGTTVQAFDADTAKTDVAQEYTATQNFNATTLTFDSTQDWSLAANQVTTLTLTGNTTFDAPAGQVDGAFYHITIKQNGTGGYTVAWNSVFKFPAGTAPTITSTASAVDELTFKSDGTNMHLVSLNQNMS